MPKTGPPAFAGTCLVETNVTTFNLGAGHIGNDNST
jgi:hypothetical protein